MKLSQASQLSLSSVPSYTVYQLQIQHIVAQQFYEFESANSIFCAYIYSISATDTAHCDSAVLRIWVSQLYCIFCAYIYNIQLQIQHTVTHQFYELSQPSQLSLSSVPTYTVYSYRYSTEWLSSFTNFSQRTLSIFCAYIYSISATDTAHCDSAVLWIWVSQLHLLCLHIHIQYTATDTAHCDSPVLWTKPCRPANTLFCPTYTVISYRYSTYSSDSPVVWTLRSM